MGATFGARRIAWVCPLALVTCGLLSCTTVDPGNNPVLPLTVFDENYFYCHIEPQFLFAPAYMCGSGDPSKADPPNGCHFNPSAVTGMALIDHPLVDCGGGDVPVDLTQVGTGSAPQTNFQSVSIEMSTDYTTAPIYLRPSSYMGANPVAHPRAVFDQSDPNVIMLLSTWAMK